MSLVAEFCAAFGAVLVESAPFVVLGFVAAGLLHEFIPTAVIRRGVGGRSVSPVLRVVGVGALLPICSCSTIPLGVGLTRCGASIGTALAFMTSSPAISPVSLILGWAVLGPVLVGWYAALAVGGAVLIGVLGNRWLGEAKPADRLEEAEGCGCGCSKTLSGGSRVMRALRWAFGELGVEVSQSLVIGLAVASLVLVAIPQELVEGWLSKPSWTAMLAAVAISLPAYTCSVPSLVIAGSLIARGVDPGVAVVFLIAGPATNLGELNAIRTAMGAKSALFYAGALITVALAAGAATSLLPLPEIKNTTAHAGHNHTHALDTTVLGSPAAPAADQSGRSLAIWRLPFAFTVVVLALVSLIRTLGGRLTIAKPTVSTDPTPKLYSVSPHETLPS